MVLTITCTRLAAPKSCVHTLRLHCSGLATSLKSQATDCLFVNISDVNVLDVISFWSLNVVLPLTRLGKCRLLHNVFNNIFVRNFRNFNSNMLDNKRQAIVYFAGWFTTHCSDYLPYLKG